MGNYSTKRWGSTSISGSRGVITQLKGRAVVTSVRWSKGVTKLRDGEVSSVSGSKGVTIQLRDGQVSTSVSRSKVVITKPRDREMSSSLRKCPVPRIC